MHRVRLAVRENALTSSTINESSYLPQIEDPGRGWVVEDGDRIVGFSVGNSATGNVWALFVDPDHEGQGYGRALHDEMVTWLWTGGLDRLWLTTTPGTRAEAFYESAGWRRVGTTATGELLFERHRHGGGAPGT